MEELFQLSYYWLCKWKCSWCCSRQQYCNTEKHLHQHWKHLVFNLFIWSYTHMPPKQKQKQHTEGEMEDEDQNDLSARISVFWMQGWLSFLSKQIPCMLWFQELAASIVWSLSSESHPTRWGLMYWKIPIFLWVLYWKRGMDWGDCVEKDLCDLCDLCELVLCESCELCDVLVKFHRSSIIQKQGSIFMWWLICVVCVTCVNALCELWELCES
jgi:hypothetical protein